jgi:hypothetical protein
MVAWADHRTCLSVKPPVALALLHKASGSSRLASDNSPRLVEMKETWQISESIWVRTERDSPWSRQLADGLMLPILSEQPGRKTYEQAILWQDWIPEGYPVFYLTDALGSLLPWSTPRGCTT